MGGQACVFYGAAEFSRDTDLAILANDANLSRLKAALADLQAEAIAVPPFDIRHLEAGHAIHFRCRHPEAAGMRVDVMSVMRGVASFSTLWRRRTTLELPDGVLCDLLSLPDLVQAKKTQRDKDWPMIRRLVEAHYFGHRSDPSAIQIKFWLLEARTPEILTSLAAEHPGACAQLIGKRPLLAEAKASTPDRLEELLLEEELQERSTDRIYWLPLKRELEKMRHSGR